MQRRLTAILAADVVNYTSLMAADSDGTLTALRRVRGDVFAPTVESHRGMIVKSMGDGWLVEFGSAADAVACALRIQSGLADDPVLRLRMGIHLGDVVHEDEDVFGDGVNIAARLESQAEARQILISDAVYGTLDGTLKPAFGSVGEMTLKNVEAPVRVWRSPPAQDAAPVHPLHAKPSIAVLPFSNMSRDPEQEYFSDGVTEDIITELSRFSELMVIARNSTFQFKARSVDTRDVARQLGVQYVVEGSVRKAGDRIRVTAQLIDAPAGTHLWADRYDRDLADVFEVQDDVVRAIVGVLPGRIAAANAERATRKPPSDLTAFDLLLRGNHGLHRRGAAIKQALGFYHQAIERDPDFAAAHAMVAIAEGMAVWDLSTFHDHPLERAYAAGKIAVSLDPNDYRCHGGFGEALRQLGQHALSRRHLERARSLNPNSAQVAGYFAMLQAYTGDPDGAIETYANAIRLDPFSQDNIRTEVLAEAHYMRRDYAASIAALETMLDLPIFYVHQQIAMSYAQLGEHETCARHMAIYRDALPGSYDERLLYESHMRLCERAEDRAHWTEGYRLTGLDV